MAAEVKGDGQPKKPTQADLDRKKQIMTSVVAMESTINRYNKIPDATMKHMLVADKFCLVADIVISVMLADISTWEDKELAVRATTAVTGTQTLIQDFQDYVMHPIYSPDKAFGAAVAEGSSNHFKAAGANGAAGEHKA